ncbi:sodium/proline symporter [Haloechinothrix alba]|uniref:Sodium/proline symporter n=1 Tax=Haloechinothrix alba TaxID=664784 RepID=A0A238XGL5_9PSEU|nr:sodium/proline symporter PutP [Haloechinothrix alba]SNR57069.1 sodium/proline symporter [Haloechinothrix alba]
MEDQTGTVVTFIVYLAIMLAIGVWVYRHTATLSDFVLGGRKLNSPTAALSANASDMSSWLLMGLPGAAYLSGLAAGWIGVGLAVGLYLSWLIVAARLRTYTEITTDVGTGRPADALTISAFFEHRFEDRTAVLRTASAAVIIVFYCVYVSSMLVATGVLFDQLFGIAAPTAMTIGVLAIVSYTFLGGFLAVSYTDVLQGILMWFALLVVPVTAMVSLGGAGSTIEQISDQAAGLLGAATEVSFSDGSWSSVGTLGAVAIISSLAWGFGYFGQPHILARFMGIRSAAAVPLARRISVTWSATAMAFAVAVGLVGIAYYADSPLGGDGEQETVFIALVQDLLPSWLAGILLAAILAAIMSTADSQLLVASSSLTEDIYRARIDKDAPPMRLVWIGRVTVIGVAVVAYLLALQGGTVLELVANAWAGFGASFGPVILLALYWRRFNWAGALAGLLGGALTVLIWPRIDTEGGLFDIGLYEMVPAVIVSFLLAAIVNFAGPTPSQTVRDDFAKAVDMAKPKPRAPSADRP